MSTRALILTRPRVAATIGGDMAGRPPSPEGAALQAGILRELRARRDAYKPAPSHRELAKKFKTNHGSIQHALEVLHRRGLVDWQPRMSRSYELTDLGIQATNP